MEDNNSAQKGNEPEFKSYVPANTDMKELTLKALLFGLLFAVILGAANAYVGLKAGMTVSATFPAAVIAIAVLRPLKGSVLEENITRTTAAVGEALVAGAIFTLPAFFISGVWDELRYWPTTLIMLIGGVLGVLFVILLRRALCENKTLPFPESVACSEIVKAGQKGESGAKYVFGSMGFAALLEFIKNDNGIKLFSDSLSKFISFKSSTVELISGGKPIGTDLPIKGGLLLQSPLVSPALIGVGYIIGFELASINLFGGLIAWFLLIPLALIFGNIQGDPEILSFAIWSSCIRPLAVGTMMVGACYTLWKMKDSFIQGIKKAINDSKMSRAKTSEKVNRLQKDLPVKWIIIGTVIMIIPMFFFYESYCKSLGGALVATLVMIITGFFFSIVGGYLVGLVGGSNQPISGLALSTLVIAAVIMVLMGIRDQMGIGAALATAAIICCSSSMAGDMIQDLKVGQIIGGTPWKMEAVVLISVTVVSFFLFFPIYWLHNGTPGGLGGENLPAPQAGLMALIAKGIIGGQMPWTLFLLGILFGIALIVLKSPSPMLIAVGMYLPIETSSAMFIGGLTKLILEKIMTKKKLSEPERTSTENVGTLVASGMVAGEAIIGVLLAGIFIIKEKIPLLGYIFKVWGDKPYGLLFIPIIAFLLIYLPLQSHKKGGVNYSVKIES